MLRSENFNPEAPKSLSAANHNKQQNLKLKELISKHWLSVINAEIIQSLGNNKIIKSRKKNASLHDFTPLTVIINCSQLWPPQHKHTADKHTETFPAVLISLSAGACSIIRDLRLLFSVWVSVNDGVLIKSIQMHKQNTTQLILELHNKSLALLRDKIINKWINK